MIEAAPNYTVEAVADILGLKKKTKGKMGWEWHGPNPTGGGATKDGFWLAESGFASDRSSGSVITYSPAEVAKMAGIAPDAYEPYAEWKRNNPQPLRNGAHGRPHLRAVPMLPKKKKKPKVFDTRSLSERGISKQTMGQFSIVRGSNQGTGTHFTYPTAHPDGSPGRRRRKFQFPERAGQAMKPPRDEMKYAWLDGDSGRAKPIGYPFALLQENAPAELWLLNGEVSVWLAWQESLPAVCTMGEGQGADDLMQALKKLGVKIVHILYDHDLAGVGGSIKAYEAAISLKLICVVHRFRQSAELPLKGGFDAADLWEHCRDSGRPFAQALGATPVVDMKDASEVDAWRDEFAEPGPEPQPPDADGFDNRLRGAAVREYIAGEPESEPDDETPAEPDGDDERPPNNYFVKNGRTYHLMSRTDRMGITTQSTVPVCDLAAHITEEIRSEEGASIFRIAGRTRQGRRFDFEIEADRFSDTKQLLAKLSNVAGANTVFHASQDKNIGPAIRSFSRGDRYSRRFNRTGWSGDEFIIPGRESKHTTIHLGRKLPYYIDPLADLKTGLTALRELLQAQDSRMTTVASVAAFQAPMALHAGWRDERYGTFINGRTNSFKSAWTVVLMCLYGPEFQNEDRLVRFGHGATGNMMMQHLVFAADMPFLIDNYKPSTGGGAKDLINLIHAIMEGGEKDRMNRDGSARQSRPIHAWPYFTGEDVPDSDAAALARMLIVPFSWTSGAENPHLTKAQELARHLCAVGGAWIDWLRSDEGRAVVAGTRTRFPDRRSMWMAKLRRDKPDMVGLQRVASNLATNELTWETMNCCPLLKPVLKPFEAEYRAGLNEVSTGMAAQTVTSLEANRYLSALRDMVVAKRLMLVPVDKDVPEDSKAQVVGWIDSEGVYLIPEVAYTEVVSFLRDSGGLGGVGNRTIHKQLQSIGALASVGADRIPVKKRVGNAYESKPQWVLHLNRTKFFEEMEEELPFTGDE